MREVLTGLAERRLVDVAEARFAEEPVLVLNGPRTVGKSTLLGQLAGRLGRPVIDCDDPATRSAVRADPGRFVESAEPVLIDEYQHVPELLDAIKAQLNRDLRPGRYVLAGSTRYAAIPAAAQALTGRVDIIPVLPLTQGEIDGIRETFVSQAPRWRRRCRAAAPEAAAATREEYARRSTSGGMPVALRRPPGPVAFPLVRQLRRPGRGQGRDGHLAGPAARDAAPAAGPARRPVRAGAQHHSGRRGDRPGAVDG